MKITNSNQFTTLVAELEKNPSLAKGFHRGNTPVDFKEQWDSIAKKLNASGPPMRDGDGWQKVWRDLKCKTKKKIIHNNVGCRTKGDGSFRELILSPLEEAVSNLVQFDKQLNPEGAVQGIICTAQILPCTASIKEEIDAENVLSVSPFNLEEQPSPLPSSVKPTVKQQEISTTARAKRKRDDENPRQRLLEKHNLMQERVLTKISTTLASLQDSMKDLSRYQRHLCEVEEKKFKLMQRAQERAEELHEKEMQLMHLKTQKEEKELQVLDNQCRRFFTVEDIKEES